MSFTAVRDAHPESTTYVTVNGVGVPWTFGEYDAEYNSLREDSALFDLSGNGLLRLTGPAHEFLNSVLARDIEFLTPDRCLTSLVLDAEGRPRDVVTVYMLEDSFLIETSLGQLDATRQILTALAPTEVDIEDLSMSHAIIGIEGPYAWGVVGRVIEPSVTALPYESVTNVSVDGGDVLFVRAGVTAEYGYKVIGEASAIAALWAKLSAETTPAGQAALETAMLEVRQPVFHRESAGDVISSGFAWLLDPTKQGYVGQAAVLQSFDNRDELPRSLGIVVNGKHDIASGADVRVDDEQIGSVTHAVFSPRLSSMVVLAQVRREYAAAGLHFTVAAGSGRVEGTSAASPYVCPKSWSTPIL